MPKKNDQDQQRENFFQNTLSHKENPLQLLNELPGEIRRRVYFHLGPKSLGRLARVSIFFKKETQDKRKR